MAIRSLRAGRQNYASETYLGVRGELFYIEETGEFRVCDAVTPGGIPILIAVATDTTVGGVRPGAGFTVSASGLLSLNAGPMFALDGSDVFQLLPATDTRLGGVKAGSGVAINPDGTILIDSEGLEFTFGDFSGTVGTYSDSTDYALLQSLKADEDIVIATNGTGSVNTVGEFNVFATNTDVTDALENYQPIFRVLSDGKVRMLVPAADALTGAFEIVGNDSGFFHPTNQTGVILHTTGQINTVNRVYHDAINNYPIVVGRRYNGTQGALENVKSGEVIFRIAGQASTGTDFETFGPAKINWMATEDQGPNNQGGKITIDVTANGTAAFGNAITALEITPEGIVSTVGFVGNVTGNADTVTNGVYTSDTGTVTNTMLAGSIANDKLANSTISGIALGSELATLSAGNYLTGTDYTGATAGTFAVDATTTNTASKVVARDASGDFAAGTITAALSGNATTATTLQTARTIGGVSFNGSANINLPGVNTAGNQNTTGSAATLTTARTIGMSGVTATATSFNGSANITIPVTAVPASLLTGTIADARISGSYTGMTNLTGTGTVDFSRFLGNTADTALLPSLSWTTDPNTGVWSPGADQVGITTGGVSRFTVSTTAVTSTLPISASNLSGTNTGDQTTVSGNAGSATVLQTARTINGVSFNGSANITVAASTTNTLTLGSYLTGTSFNGSSAVTAAVDATTTNTASKVVARDANGDTFANQVNDSKGDVRSVPINGQSGAYSLAATDNGKMISITTGGVSVLQNVFADPYGQIISIYNNSNSSQTITQGAGVTLRLAGTAATGNRTLARYGVATITCVAANTFVISGAGIT